MKTSENEQEAKTERNRLTSESLTSSEVLTK